MKRLTLLLVICFYLTTLFSEDLTRKPEMNGSLKVRDVSINYLNKYTDSKLTTVSTDSKHSQSTEIQVMNTYNLDKNSLLAPGVIIDTLVSFVIGSTVPPQDPNGGDIINGGFTIERSGNDPVTGNGIDEITRWNFTYANPNINSSSQVISAQLTLIIEQKDAGASNDFVQGDNCGCTSIFVGLYPLNVIDTVQFEMLNLGYESQLFIDHIIADGFPMFYQDDAIVSFAELKLIISNTLNVLEPNTGELWIAGETDTIKWNGGASGQFFNIEFSIDSGNTYSLITIGVPADSGYYIWNIPQNILSTKVKIKISDFTDSTTFVASDTFKIKGYVLTKYLPNGDYIPYSMLTDAWGFANYPSDEWPVSWYSRFNYQGTDPFTGSQYSQWQGNLIFVNSLSSNHPDWPSFVNTFGTSACYISTFWGIYSPTALSFWESIKGVWRGSCFGIAISNFLAWENKTSFLNRYPNFPNFTNPNGVLSDINTIPVINELFTYQFGNPHRDYKSNIGLNKTPVQTLNDLKQMLITEGAPVQTLSFMNNGNAGGHAILSYKVEKDSLNPNIFYAYVYDNSYPDSLNARIVFNTTANGGNGSWSFNHWLTWGGNRWIYLRDAVSNYLTNPTLNKGTIQQSPFTMGDNLLRVNAGIDASVQIKDTNGNTTGYVNGSILLDIPNSIPLIVDNGSETPPYGYELPAENYSITLNSFTQETTKTFFFTDNKIFSYQRSGTVQTQTDNLFFDGGISVTNNDIQIKTVSLLNIINETSQEKLFVVRSVELVQNDSVKIENPDSNKFKLISYGSSKDYDLELNYVTENGVGRFGDFNIPLDANTSHTLVPDWSNLTNAELTILVDTGNDGTIDDTLSLINQVTGIGDDQGSLITPNSYNLAQNFPNPFNPSTTIKFSIPKLSFVVLKIYDVLGNEVATLVSEEKAVGSYEVKFNAIGLSSGIYFYKLQAGSFVETKKMILIK